MCSLTDDGQATVEAALTIPVLMILALMLLQPGIVLYDRIVMNAAAAEGCRLLATTSSSNADTNDDYIRRRLSAIPQLDIFHVHGSECSYDIDLSGDESSDEVAVSITNRIKPLPLLDLGMRITRLTDESGSIPITVCSSMKTQPSWVQPSAGGTSPSEWVRS